MRQDWTALNSSVQSDQKRVHFFVSPFTGKTVEYSLVYWISAYHCGLKNCIHVLNILILFKRNLKFQEMIVCKYNMKYIVLDIASYSWMAHDLETIVETEQKRVEMFPTLVLESGNLCTILFQTLILLGSQISSLSIVSLSMTW